MAATLDEYIAEMQVYETQILSMDKDAPRKADIDKICGIMSLSIGMDKFEYVKSVCQIMKEQNKTFQEAIAVMRNR